MQQAELDFTAAKERANTGMRRAADRAERSDPGWTERALTALGEYARSAGIPFTIEQARQAIAQNVGAPAEERAWGAVTRMARKRGVIKPSGRFMPAASSNGSSKPAWVSGEAME